MLPVDYQDRLACPVGSGPVKQIGDWTTDKGEWFFKSGCVSVKKPTKYRPERNAERYTNLRRRVDVTDRGITRSEMQDEWHWLATHECCCPEFNGGDFHGVFQRQSCVPYKGDLEAEYDRVFQPLSAVEQAEVASIVEGDEPW